MRFLFWASAAFVLYTFLGYAVWAWLMARLRPRPVRKAPLQPRVSLVMAVHNGANFIEAKLRNFSQLAYPKERLEIVVASDGSSDDTTKMLNSVRDIRTVVCPRVGKAEALNSALRLCSGEIVVFTDVRQKIEPNAISELVANFADENVGCVSGELMFSPSSISDDGSVSGLPIYWRLEKLIRRCESASGSVMGATGALYAVRRTLVEPLPTDTLLDDVFIPLQVLRHNKRVVFEPEARVWDSVTENSSSEFSRKVRTLAGNFQIVQLMPWVLTDRAVQFRFTSHKLTRLLAPWFLIAMLLSSWMLSGTTEYFVLAVLQTAVYALAMIALYVPSLSRLRFPGAALAFCILNIAAICAALQYFRYRNKPTRLWVVQSEKAAVRGTNAVVQER